jgi:hypothetical protein
MCSVPTIGPSDTAKNGILIIAKRIVCAALLVAPLLFMSSGTRASAQTGDEIIVATPPNDSSGEVFYAADMGFFAKAGLNVKVMSMNNAGAAQELAVAQGCRSQRQNAGDAANAWIDKNGGDSKSAHWIKPSPHAADLFSPTVY